MSLFKKKEMKEEKRLPELPKLPELPSMEEKEDMLPQLPSLPSNSLGNKFSQDMIKEAVTGEKEEMADADEFADEKEEHRMLKPSIQKEIPKQVSVEEPKQKENEPIFIRIDKFEEGSNNFEEVKKQISEIEKMFENLKVVKEKEEEEMSEWESEIKQIKEKIEKINRNIFSKI